jgi:hypothetical protein
LKAEENMLGDSTTYCLNLNFVIAYGHKMTQPNDYNSKFEHDNTEPTIYIIGCVD